MNDFQVAYLAALVLLTFLAWGRQRFAALCLWGNLVATLAICLAMDMETMGRDTATLSMLITDLATGAVLASRPGIARLIAWGYAITVPIYSVNLVWLVPIHATYAIIYIVAAAQLGVLAIGSIGNSGGHGGRRNPHRPSMALQIGDLGVSQGPISRNASTDRVAK